MSDGENPKFTLKSTRAAVFAQFISLVDIWSEDTAVLSSTTEIINHRCYKQIIDMGEEVVPLLIFGVNLGEWFLGHAIYKITGENPVPEEHRGNMQEVANDWVKWGIEKGYVDEDDLRPKETILKK